MSLSILNEKVDELQQSSSCSLATTSSEDDESSITHMNKDCEEVDLCFDRLQLNKSINRKANLSKLIRDLYKIDHKNDRINNDTYDESTELCGYLEMLPHGKSQKNSILLTWKKRYFFLRLGRLTLQEHESSYQILNTFHIMGGRVDVENENIICLDDSRGNCVVMRCPTHELFVKWREALERNVLDRPELMWTRPLLNDISLNQSSTKRVLIIDMGTCSVRAGLYTHQPKLPQIFMPNVCLRDSHGYKVGFEAFENSTSTETSKLIFPLKSKIAIDKFGIDFDCVEATFVHLTSKLAIKSDEYEVLLITPQKYSDRIHVELMKILLEKLNFAAITILNQSFLVLYSYNATSGIVVNLSEKIEIVPICDGIIFQNGVTNLAYGASTMSNYLNSFVSRSHYNFINDAEQYLVRFIKEKSSYIAENYKQELLKPINDLKLVIDGCELDIARFESSEGLFNPEIWGMDGQGIHKLILKAIQSCSIDLRREMAKSIYLSGGMAQIPGLSVRLEKELKNLLPTSLNIKVHNSPYSYHSAFLGAHEYISRVEYEKMCVTREEWAIDNVNSLKKWRIV